MKISILTPTYNDEASIAETYQSLINQSYHDWEWIVINDGSTDRTGEMVKGWQRNGAQAGQMIYLEQENADQLNALLHGLKAAGGDYIFILHSDDLLPDENFLKRCVETMQSHPEIDGLFGDLLLINEQGEIIGRQEVLNYRRNRFSVPETLLWLGRNLYCDMAFHKAAVFKTRVKETYLTWNMPLWLDFQEATVDMLNYMKASFPILKYRVHEGNYINQSIGKMNVINGELRTAVELMRYYDIPCYRLQYYAFRIFHRLFPKRLYPVCYRRRPNRNRLAVISFIVAQRYPNGVKDVPFLNELLCFYEVGASRCLTIEKMPADLLLYYGKDMRRFHQDLLSGQLPPFYQYLLKQMRQGFSCVKVNTLTEKKQMEVILKFLCIGHIPVICE